MNIFQSLSGMIIIEITDAEPEKICCLISTAQIPISNITRKSELTYQFQISAKDYSNLAQFANHRHIALRIVQKQGIFWCIGHMVRRPVMVIGILMILLLSLYLPSRILIVEVSGNTDVPTKQILDAAEDCGISFFTLRRSIRNEKVKNQLLSAIPQLQWVGINTYGCRAVISVRERTEQKPVQNSHTISNLIAEKDGYILSQTILSGTPMVQPGDTVTAGQILISGYTDCDFGIQATRASGEILAQTRNDLLAVMPVSQESITETSDVYYRISLLLRKKRINLWNDSRISDTSCGRMYEEYFVSLPGGYQLPVAVCVDRYISYTTRETVIPEADAYQILQNDSDRYLLRQMHAGRILEKQQQAAFGDVYRLQSRYICTEIIGREQWEQIGDQNGKRD